MSELRTKFASLLSGLNFEKLSYAILVFTISVAPVFFVPSAFFQLAFAKSLFLFVGVSLALLSLLIATLKSGRMFVPNNSLLLSLAVIALAFFVSSFRINGNFSLSILPKSLTGYGFEVGTFVFILLMVILVYLVAALVTSKDRLFKLQIFFSYSLVVVVAFHVLRLIATALPDAIGTPVLSLLSFGVFNSTVSSVVGGWNDLGIFFTVGLFSSIIALKILPLDKPLRLINWCIFFASLVFLVIIDFSTLWLIVGLVAILLLLYFFSLDKIKRRFLDNKIVFEDGSSPEYSDIKKTSWRGIMILLIASAIIFGFASRIPAVSVWMDGVSLGGRVASVLGVPNTEIRPSWIATVEVGRQSLSENTIFGVGPNRFVYGWLNYKPDGINSTVFWNTDFNYGFGLIPTFAITTGILGILAWLLFFAVFLFVGIKSLFFSVSEKSIHYLTLSTFIPALILWIVNIIYVPGAVVFALTFVFTGLFAAVAIQTKTLRSTSFIFNKAPKNKLIASLTIALTIIGIVLLLHGAASRALSSYFLQKAVLVYRIKGDFGLAYSDLEKSQNLKRSDINSRAFVDLDVARIRGILVGQDYSTTTQELFNKTLIHGFENANAALADDPQNYQNWIAMGQIFEVVMSVRIQNLDAYGQAKIAYGEALKRNPESPLIRLLLARVEASKGDFGKAKEYISEALNLKSNYTDALFLLSQIQVSEGNLEDAVSSIESSLNVSADPSLYFQLGLLQYSKSAFSKAVSAFENAVRLVPSYANARYFLGLSYEKLGRISDAVTQFVYVQELNPDNQEVKLILSNLRAGRAPFADAKPPVDDEPENRLEPPVKEE